MKLSKWSTRLLSIILLSLFVLIFEKSSPESVSTPVQSTRTITITPTETISSSSAVLVSRVIDGDTIVLADGSKVRYIGINSPEISSHQCYSQEAKQKNENLVLNKTVILKKDISETDKYNRLLRYIYLSDGTFVNKELVAEGYAYATSYPPDVSHQQELKQAQEEAKAKNNGFWSNCSK